MRVFADHGESSRRTEHPQRLACLDHLRRAGILVVCRLDRIAGTETMAIETVDDLTTAACPSKA